MRIYPDMPDVTPIPARTKGLPWWKATWNFLTVPTFWRLDSDYAYRLVDGTWVLFRRGFSFDGTTTPRVFWPLINPDGILFIPALPHDQAYRHGCLYRIDDNIVFITHAQQEVYENHSLGIYDTDFTCALKLSPYMQGASRGFWDETFYDEGNAVNGMRPINYAAWLALKVFGGFAWNKWRKTDGENKEAGTPM